MIGRDQEKFDRDIEAERDKVFDLWVNSPMTKVVLELIPPSASSPEAVRTLLKSAFDAGFSTGAGTFLLQTIEAALKDRKKS